MLSKGTLDRDDAEPEAVVSAMRKSESSTSSKLRQTLALRPDLENEAHEDLDEDDEDEDDEEGDEEEEDHDASVVSSVTDK